MAKKTKVLLITYYWPPSGGAGVQRWVKLTKYLTQLDVECHVITVDPSWSSYTVLDDSLIDDISPGVEVHTTKTIEPLAWYGKLLGRDKIPSGGFSNVNTQSFLFKCLAKLRSHTLIPDPRVGWNPFAIARAKKVLEKHAIETVITTSPPHSSQLVGLALKRWKASINWICDLRDPWTDIYYYDLLGHSHCSHSKNQALEQEVLENCDHLVTVSKGFFSLFQEKTKQSLSEKLLILRNGYDAEDFEHLIETPRFARPAMTITYTGTMSDQYEIGPFIDALELWNHQAGYEKYGIQIVGKASCEIEETISKKIPYRFEGTVDHSLVSSYQRNADALLLIVPNADRNLGIIPGKAFEYMAAGKPIVYIGPQKGELADILKECSQVIYFDPSKDEDQLQLEALGSSASTADWSRYSRKNQAKKLLDLL